MKILVKIWHLLVLFFVLTLLSCTESGDEYCDPADRPYQKGMIDLLFSVSGQEEITPQTRHGAPTPGTADENSVTTLHVFIFDNAGNLETLEVINIDAATGTATDARTGDPHPNWLGGARRKLRVNINQGDKTIAVVANWRTDNQRDDDMPPLFHITTLSELQAIERLHYEGDLPTNPPVMCGVKYTNIDGSETDLLVNLERQIARVDFYPAISNQLKKLNVELKIRAVKFNKVSGYSYLTYHTNGGTPPEPISPTYNPLWDLPDNAWTRTPNDVINITDPAAVDAVKYATLYIPENIASGEEGATELLIAATYNGKETYYGVKLHNGKSDADKRFWVERNHFYRYNITITGIGSDDVGRPSWNNVQVGVSNDEWVGGESTSPGFGIELPLSEIEVVHFKGITRFELPGDYSVDSNVDWLSAHRIVEGEGANQRTYLEIMTRTNNTGSERTGEVTVLTKNGASSTMKVKQLTEAASLWKNPNDNTTWYRANIGAARIEDPGFFYQWGRNVAYSPYTPVKSIAPHNQNPLHNYGTINWNDIPQIFPQETPSVSWENDIILIANPRWPEETVPCPPGYDLPHTTMFRRLWEITAGPPIEGAYAGRIMVNGEPGYWFNGDKNITNVPSNLNLGVFFLDHGWRDYQYGATSEVQTYYWSVVNFRETIPFAGFVLRLHPGIINSATYIDKRSGAFVRCVKTGNVLYDGGAPDATGTMTDSRFYEVGEEVLPLASTYAREGYRQSGWQVIGSNGRELVRGLPLTGTSFSFPAEAEADYVTLRAVWIKQVTNRWYNNGVLIATDTGDVGSSYVVPNAPPSPSPEWQAWGCWRNRGNSIGDPGDPLEHTPGNTYTRHTDLNWHADWKWRRRYFNNGVELTNLEQQGYDGSPFITQQPPAAPVGHVFRHWKWANSWGETGTLGAGVSDVFNNGCRFEAEYIPEQYSAVFDSNGGAPLFGRQWRWYGETWDDPGRPERSGYTFGGWVSADGQVLGGAAQGNARFVARWVINKYTLYVDNVKVRDFNVESGTLDLPAYDRRPVVPFGNLRVGYYEEVVGGEYHTTINAADFPRIVYLKTKWIERGAIMKDGWLYLSHGADRDIYAPTDTNPCGGIVETINGLTYTGWVPVTESSMEQWGPLFNTGAVGGSVEIWQGPIMDSGGHIRFHLEPQVYYRIVDGTEHRGGNRGVYWFRQHGWAPLQKSIYWDKKGRSWGYYKCRRRIDW